MCGFLKLMVRFKLVVYSKPVDAHQYLNFRSCHPPHVKRGIPYSQALRLKRICSNENQLRERLGDLKGFLVKRGYKEDFVENQFSRTNNLRRVDLLERKKRAEVGNKNSFVIDYHPALQDLYGIFKELQQIVGWSGSFLSIMPDLPRICFRRAKNLKDHLVRSKLPNELDEVGGMFRCGNKRCKVCQNVIEGSKFKSFVEDRIFHINHHFDCNSEGVIYLVDCRKCGKQYVGCTITSFRTRFNNHKSSLNRYGEGKRNICGQQLYAHFYGEGHLGLKDFMVRVIDTTNVNDPTKREGFWIEKINCYAPLGLNERKEC